MRVRDGFLPVAYDRSDTGSSAVQIPPPQEGRAECAGDRQAPAPSWSPVAEDSDRTDFFRWRMIGQIQGHQRFKFRRLRKGAQNALAIGKRLLRRGHRWLKI